MVMIEPQVWFVAQAGGVVVAVLVGLVVRRSRPRVWKGAALVSTILMLAWPMMRLWPAQATGLFSARVIVHIEVTGIVLPAALVFDIAAGHMRKAAERRALYLLLGVCALYFVQSGLWMIAAPVPDLGRTRVQGGVCLQSTGYTLSLIHI